MGTGAVVVSITVDGEIYAISGAGAETVHVVEIYDVATDTWRQGPPIPTQRGWFGAALHDGRIYACGGKRVRPEQERKDSGDDYVFEIRDSVEVLVVVVAVAVLVDAVVPDL